jgi:topoisomerase-4 subunit A
VVEGVGHGNKPVTLNFSPAQRVGLRHRRARRGTALAPKAKPERMG